MFLAFLTNIIAALQAVLVRIPILQQILALIAELFGGIIVV